MTYSFASFPARDRLNDRIVLEVRATGPTSYVTGGDNITPAADLGLGDVFGVYGHLSNGTLILQLWWNYTTQRLLMIVTATGAEVANGTDLSTYTGTLLITGKG